MKKWVFILIGFLVSFLEIGTLALASETETGTFYGRVLLDRNAPAAPQLLIDKSVEFCGEVLADPVLVIQDKKIQGAIVSIEWDNDVILNPSQNVSLQSRRCLFQPRIQAAQVGTFLTLNSGDDITHNPHGWWNNEKTVFNITLLNPEKKFKRKLKRPGIYRVECDTHTWMKAYILVFNHPFYSVTDEEGMFRLENIPVGTHTIRVWHEILGEQTATVVVNTKKTTRMEFVFPLVDKRRKELIPKTVTPWPPNRNTTKP